MSTPPLSRKDIQKQVVALGWYKSHTFGHEYVYYRGEEDPLYIPLKPEVSAELAQKILQQAQPQTPQ